MTLKNLDRCIALVALCCAVLYAAGYAQTITPAPLVANPQVSYLHLWRNAPVGLSMTPPRQDYQSVDRPAQASCGTIDPNRRVCFTFWIVDRDTNSGIPNVAVQVNSNTIRTNSGGMISTSVHRNQDFTLKVPNVAGYSPSPVLEGLTKHVDSLAVLGLLELKKQ